MNNQLIILDRVPFARTDRTSYMRKPPPFPMKNGISEALSSSPVKFVASAMRIAPPHKLYNNRNIFS